jgi:glucose/arabinose dehydrogenase
LPYSAQTVLIGPDNHIYLSLGSGCNVCIESDPHRAAVWQYDLDGSHGRLYAKGLWNVVGMAVNPWMGQVWADIDEREVIGGSIPPEAVYALVDQGNYGWPRCNADVTPNAKFGLSAGACKGVQRPIITLQARSSPLGMAFYPLVAPLATQFPERYRGSLYVALHGSGKSSILAGDKIVRIPIDCGKMAGHVEDFITGWLNADGTSSGHPTGITFAPDGSMFISDDQAGLIYHVWYQN